MSSKRQRCDVTRSYAVKKYTYDVTEVEYLTTKAILQELTHLNVTLLFILRERQNATTTVYN